MLAVLLALLSAPTEASAPPAVLAPYFRGEEFDPGDYRWMRGYFDDATPQQKAEWQAVQQWLRTCREAGLAKVRAELAEMDFRDPPLEGLSASDTSCAQVNMPWPLAAKSFADFERAAAEARPVAEAYLHAVRAAEQVAFARSPALAEQLRPRLIGEQMLRTAMTWEQGVKGSNPPVLSPDARAVLMARIGAAASVRDRANTRWLKQVVADQGWPTIPKAGEGASGDAWLLVQHADADPAFQLKALRLMEPLAARGEVSPRNYAYLYDRVMVKLSGKQRYATQGMCKAGKWEPRPLEEPDRVDRLRVEMQLGPLADYLKLMNREGMCPR